MMAAREISSVLMWKINIRFLIFGENFLLLEGRKSIFFSASICRNRTCKFFENRSTDNVFMAKMNFE